MTSGAGDGSLLATSTATYDPVGNAITLDGPLAGNADTVRARYNASREVVGMIGPDPDGAGPRKHRAERLTRGAYGEVTLAETGAVNGQSDADWAGFAASEAVETGYDANTRPVTSKLVAGSTTYALTQTSYDALGRPECTAVRMNPAAFASPPASACTLGTQGSFGPDRVSRATRDALGRVIELKSAIGAAAEGIDVSTVWTANGLVDYVVDGEGNATDYAYDGHDRLWFVSYPSPTVKGDTVPANSEQRAFDANGNITQLRRRDGQLIGFAYDALDRVTLKDLPGSEPDVSYAHDLLGRMTGASQPGHALTFAYDALGRTTSVGGPLGTTSYQHDLAGRRTRLTMAGGFFVTYDIDVTGAVTAIRENGATSGGACWRATRMTISGGARASRAATAQPRAPAMIRCRGWRAWATTSRGQRAT